MTLDAQRWAMLQPLIDQALELEGPAQAAFIAGLAQADAAAARDLSDFLEKSRRSADAPAATPPGWLRAVHPGPGRIGSEIAGYRIEAEIGRGGMGSVWRARSSAEPGRVVAIKLLDLVGSRDGVLARFGRERDLLARLDHPHIARLFDAGISGGGEPFLVLEYIEGMPIDRWCEERQVDLRARMRLVEQVADAVQAAHAQLIVHRDLKPANVLVDAGGRAVVLDFGIARLLDDEEGAPSLTRQHGAALTPAYAAPEQLRGEPASAAIDVHGLGLLAFELVDGRRAYTSDAPRDAVPQVQRADAELATVIAKAMAVDAHERYASARELADDLAAWREYRPIRARAPSLTYRARKFVRRHRGGVVAGMIALLAALAGVSATVWQAQVARGEAERAAAEAARATAYSEILLRVFADPEASGSVEQSARMLQRGAELLRRLGQLEDPDAVAEVMGRWASMMPARNLAEEAIVLYRDAETLARSPELRQRLQCRRLGVLLALQPHWPEARAMLEQIHDAIAQRPDAPEYAECHRVEANYWRERRDFERALAALDRADAAYRALPDYEAGSRSLVRYSRGVILLRLNRVNDAERELQGALADITAQGRAGDTLAYEVHYELASMARRRSDFVRGVEHLRRAIALRAARGDADPLVHAARARLGNLLAWMGRTAEARALLIEAESKSRPLLNSNAWLESAQLLARWAIVWGDHDLAQAVIDRQRARFTAHGTSVQRANRYADYLQAVLDGRRGELAQAEQGIAAAVAQFRAEGEAALAHLPRALAELAAVRWRRGDRRGAEAAVREALAADAPDYERAEWQLLLAEVLATSDSAASASARATAQAIHCRVYGRDDVRCRGG
jgi:serine/threonine-protein kinase